MQPTRRLTVRGMTRMLNSFEVPPWSLPRFEGQGLLLLPCQWAELDD